MELKSNRDMFKEVELETYNDNEGIEKIQNNFISAMKSCEKEIIGSDRIGSSVEFYDEDGVVLLNVLFDDITNKAVFEFTTTNEKFDISLTDMPEMFAPEPVYVV